MSVAVTLAKSQLETAISESAEMQIPAAYSTGDSGPAFDGLWSRYLDGRLTALIAGLAREKVASNVPLHDIFRQATPEITLALRPNRSWNSKERAGVLGDGASWASPKGDIREVARMFARRP